MSGAGLKKKVKGEFVDVGGDSDSLFRGAWAGGEVVEQLSFSGESLDAAFTATGVAPAPMTST